MADSYEQYTILVGGSQVSPEWAALAERVLPAALLHLAERGIAPVRCEVSVALVDDTEIHALNQQYRGVDAPTDVLSFAQLEGDGPDTHGLPPGYPVPLGDLVVSIPRMRAQAVEYGHSAARELGFLLVHGLLHLLGYDHEAPEDAFAMRAEEEALLASAGLARGTPAR